MVTSGLVGFWPLSEWSGRANDLSGNDNHGTLNGGVVQGVAGKSGLTSYSFDASDDYIAIGSAGSNAISGFGPYTITAFARFDDLSERRTIVARDNGGSDRHAVGVDGSGVLQHSYYDGNNWNNAGRQIQTNKWYHICAVATGSKIQCYINGEFVSNEPSNNAYSDGAGSDIGRSGSNQGISIMDGNIQDVRFYNRALSASEAKYLSQVGSVNVATPPNASDANAVSRWSFDDRSDTSTALDEWGANSGTISGATYNADSIRGLSMNFDGDDYVEVTNLSGSDLDIGNGSVTMSAWIKLNSASSFGYILDTSDGSANGAYSLASDNGTLGVILEDSTTAETENVDTGVWYHFVGVATSSGNSYAYLNGVRRGEDTWDGEFNTVDVLNIGRGVNDTTYVDSIIDDVRIYDRALSDEEIQQLYLWGTRGTDRRYEVLQQ